MVGGGSLLGILTLKNRIRNENAQALKAETESRKNESENIIMLGDQVMKMYKKIEELSIKCIRLEEENKRLKLQINKLQTDFEACKKKLLKITEKEVKK